MSGYDPTDYFKEQVLAAYPGSVVEKVIPTLYLGWECDPYAAVVTSGGAPFLVATNHGSLHRVSDPGKFLKDLRKSYSDAAAQTKDAARLLSVPVS